MKIEQESKVSASRERIWSLLEDVPRAAALIPGVSDVVETGPNTFSGKMQARVGPMKITLDGELTTTQNPEDFTWRIEGNAKALAGGGLRVIVDAAHCRRGRGQLHPHRRDGHPVHGQAGHDGTAVHPLQGQIPDEGLHQEPGKGTQAVGAGCATDRRVNGRFLMKRKFAASVIRDGDWYVAQALEVDVTSQGETEQEALDNLREALELYFTPPLAEPIPKVHQIEVDIDAKVNIAAT